MSSQAKIHKRIPLVLAHDAKSANLLTKQLPWINAETLLQARRMNPEGDPLSGDLPYFAATFGVRPKCPCARTTVSLEASARSISLSTKIASTPAVFEGPCKCFPVKKMTTWTEVAAPELQEHLSQLQHHKVFVRNLNPEVGLQELVTALCRIGQVRAVEIFRERLESSDAYLRLDDKPSSAELRRKKSKSKTLATSSVYGWLYFDNPADTARALAYANQIFGVVIKGFECRMQPLEEKVKLLLSGLPPTKSYAGVQSTLDEFLFNAGRGDAGLLELSIRKETKQTLREGVCVLEFEDHWKAARAFQLFHQHQPLAWPGVEAPLRLQVSWDDRAGPTKFEGRIKFNNSASADIN